VEPPPRFLGRFAECAHHPTVDALEHYFDASPGSSDAAVAAELPRHPGLPPDPDPVSRMHTL
jgi:hypothetical protein